MPSAGNPFLPPVGAPGCGGCAVVEFAVGTLAVEAFPMPFALPAQEISYFFLEPYRSELCATYRSCLACLADQGCGWCPLSATCHRRLAQQDDPGACGAASVRLILVPNNCVLCEDYRDCHACSKVRGCGLGSPAFGCG